MKINQKGFSAIEILLVIVVVGLLGVVGFMVYKNQDKKTATTTNTQTSTDPYAGWKTYCDSSTGGCFRYPSDWGALTPMEAQGVKASGQNKSATMNLFYSKPVDGKGGLDSFVTKSLNAVTTSNDSYKVVGGYYTVSNNPGYELVDSTLAQQLDLAVGKTSNVGANNNLYFTKNSKKASLTVTYNNTRGSTSINASQADAWFNSSDGKTALLILKSFYAK